MICKDKSTTYLKHMGYNVVRHPRAGIGPLGVIGNRNKSVSFLGQLQNLLRTPPDALPAVMSSPAADINGRQSDKLELGIGANILGNLIGAMGGNLGISVSYTNAKNIEFTFADVVLDSVELLQLGQALKDARVATDNPFVAPFIKDGELLLITKTIKSNKIIVNYQKADGSAAEVDVPVVKELVGGNVEVGASGASASILTFTGTVPLVFGFAAYAIDTDRDSGEMELKPKNPGTAVMADLTEDSFQPRELSKETFLDI